MGSPAPTVCVRRFQARGRVATTASPTKKTATSASAPRRADGPSMDRRLVAQVHDVDRPREERVRRLRRRARRQDDVAHADAVQGAAGRRPGPRSAAGRASARARAGRASAATRTPSRWVGRGGSAGRPRVRRRPRSGRSRPGRGRAGPARPAPRTGSSRGRASRPPRPSTPRGRGRPRAPTAGPQRPRARSASQASPTAAGNVSPNTVRSTQRTGVRPMSNGGTFMSSAYGIGHPVLTPPAFSVGPRLNTAKKTASAAATSGPAARPAQRGPRRPGRGAGSRGRPPARRCPC